MSNVSLKTYPETESVHKIMNTIQCLENKISTRNPCDFFLFSHREHMLSNSYYRQTATNKHNVPFADNLYKLELGLYQVINCMRPCQRLFYIKTGVKPIKTVNGISRD